MCAAFGNHSKCITLLLTAGADPSVATTAHNDVFDAGPGTTALDLATKNGHGEAMVLLKPADASEPQHSTDLTANANDAVPTATPTKSRLQRLSKLKFKGAVRKVMAANSMKSKMEAKATEKGTEKQDAARSGASGADTKDDG